MESSSGEVDGNTEELSGRKKSRFKLLKTRLFGRLRKKDTEGQMKQSKSTNDVTAQGGRRGEDDSEDDCQYPQGTLSSRALSHDSIFLADQSQASEPTRVLSQENVHSKIKALQLKLQQQNMRLGPPPLLIHGKCTEDFGTMSEDDGLPCSPPEMSFPEVATHEAAYKHPEAKKHLSSLSLAGTGSEEEEQGGSSQPSSRPLSPVSRLSPPELISSPTDLSSSSGVDFSSPAHYVSCLDNSAARHRMSIKPRNQRASTKGKKQSPVVYRLRSSSMNSLDEPLSEGEEEPQRVTSTKNMDHQSYPSQFTNLEEELSSPVPASHSSALEALTLNVGPLSKDDNEQKSVESSQPEDRITTNPLSFQHETTALEPLHSTREQVGNECLNTNNAAPQPTCPGALSTVSDSTVPEETTSESANQIETLKKSAEALSRPHPVPAPRTKKPTLDSRTSKISNAKPRHTEKETDLPASNGSNPVSSERLDESSREDDKQLRPNSFRFSIASAKYRSKTLSGEHVTKPDEESSNNMALLKKPLYSQNLEKVENEKTLEVSKTTLSTLSRRTSLQSVGPQIVSNPALGNEGCSHSAEEKSEKEESEEIRGLFGVKLRTTSLPLKYRSDVAKPEVNTKRHSLDAHQMLTVSEGHAGKEPCSAHTEDKDRKSSFLTNNVPHNSDTQQDVTVDTDSDREASTGSGPVWKSLAREKTKAHQPSFLKANSTASATPSTSCSQQPQRPTPQPRPHLWSTEKSQLRSCHSSDLPQDHHSQIPPKAAPRVQRERQALTNQERSTGSQLANGAELADIKGTPKHGVKTNSQTEPDALKRTPTLTSTLLSRQQSQSDRGQPSWMELAKRKSLAWSDKSVD